MNELTEVEKDFDRKKLKEMAIDLLMKINNVKDFNSKVAIASAFNVLMDMSKGL